MIAWKPSWTGGKAARATQTIGEPWCPRFFAGSNVSDGDALIVAIRLMAFGVFDDGKIPRNI